MKNRIVTALFLLLLVLVTAIELSAQVQSSALMVLNRGKLWQTYSYGKSGPPFGDWAKKGVGLDWPGFDPSLINDNLGGSASYLVSGGMYVGAKWSSDSVITVDDWAMYAGSISDGANAKYVVTTNKEVYPNGANYWVQKDAHAGEQVLRTVWEYNKNYTDKNEEMYKRMLPIRVTRIVHQWSGSKTDENYVIVEYVVKNISPELREAFPTGRFIADTLYDFYSMLSYGIHCNSREWSVLFPALTPGARNTQFAYDAARRTILGRAVDDPGTAGGVNEEMGLAASMGPLVNGIPTGEYLAPAIAGFSLLYASKNKSSLTSNVVQYGWSAADNTRDTGPFTNIPSLPEPQYAVLKDIRNTYHFVASSSDTLFMKRSRMWSLMSLGPWNILPGDSIRIVIAEVVDGVDYSRAIDPKNNSASTLATDCRKAFNATVTRAQFSFDNLYAHPNPPAAPKFIVDYNRGSRRVANVITWTNEAESMPDAYDGTTSLAGYLVYRSGYLPIGAWVAVDTVKKGDARYFSAGRYTYIDSSVSIGKGYYYALTAYNTGRASWTGVTTLTNVGPMETSIFANRTATPFVATLPPSPSVDNVLVVPNPFVIGAGFAQPGSGDKIQFVNIPNPCTIRIYTVRGDLVKTLPVGADVGSIVSWDQVTDFGQFVKSGIYIYHLESPFGTKTGKLAIVR
ncbi:MAG: hypothetical protein NTV54_09615 [Ignavibacteriales bacterium]|nr:hypothetical protein [Ignavibacteriales bacterium]